MKWITDKAERITVGIVGLGYVGLPLALQFCSSGNKVIGFDVDQSKVNSINAGISYISHLKSENIAKARANNDFWAVSDFRHIADVDAVIICVPTPLTKHYEPDIKYILAAANQIGPYLKTGHLIVLESTTYPGTTTEDFRPVLEKISGLQAGRDFSLVFSPEREDPGNVNFKIQDIPKVVGGFTEICSIAGQALYQKANLKTIAVSSCNTAEAVKLLENIFRLINISMVNELKIIYAKMGIDIWEVISAAKTKPFGYMPFYPGPGIGGHCIPIDPFYLTWKAKEVGEATRFIQLAGEINNAMPKYVVNSILEALSDRGQCLKGAKIGIIGIAYKKDISDVRESPAFYIWELLKRRGAEVVYHDPLVDEVPYMQEHADFAGIKSTQIADLQECAAVVIITDHSSINYNLLLNTAKLVIDTRNIYPSGTKNVIKG